jgi:phage terminase large subunit-like protein
VGDPEKFRELEDQMCNFVPGMSQSPDRLDSMVYGITELLLLSGGWARGIG